ncbi:nitrite/sulfite reductase [Marinospirillum alkaliphilum]|uniref:Sulfite reductase (NADPH) hemoprotein beta-component n=1 Tax=Marinospirillum alkaliphilum DSM 21637 TaxID=1122209 RepID=A0A1K1YXE2_9GAMM|nr:nitrite/sulfite reductase [Marinospirillum alkaliphilum]SFX65957.1 sulfite reductase (NADPH) hemoprotein beta-component [Marinospirillum alkaliphilum DSM 21637]
MYVYNQVDQQLVDQRVEQFRDQTRRFLAGELPDEEFLALRLMNGLYIQRQAPMLRVAIPYGTFSATQMRTLAHIARTWDRGYGHFTTRTNIQFNWPKLEEVPDILAELAKVQMHAIQTSGNCIRNTTTDPLAGVAADEIEDPRPWCELIRQWSTLHPEFAYLPRKFKIAVSGGPNDRASSRVHDIGLELVRNEAGETGFKVLVGGGLGRTPFIGKVIREYLEPLELFTYLEAILRIYNLKGRRDNKYKARIKILVAALGIDEFRRLVEDEWQHLKGGELRLTEAKVQAMKDHFQPFAYDAAAASDTTLQQALASHEDFRVWYERNTQPHRVAGYRIVHLSLKPLLGAPGDITHLQMDVVADLAEAFSFGEIRATQDQNLVLTDVQQKDLFAVWQRLRDNNLARANINTLTDMIVCPGFDFCSLANARTLNIADQINQLFDDLDYLHDLGDIQLNMSGCINACAHHHIGHIGILGVDKKGEDWYQITLGGSATENARLGKVLGKAVAADEVAGTLKVILDTYLSLRQEGESFVEALDRVGIEPFKAAVYEPV